MSGSSERDIEEIIENMASKLYFHGHPINRNEARKELRLKVLEKPSLELEGAMWSLYKEFELEFRTKNFFTHTEILQPCCRLQRHPAANI